jgi:hypothetical protein
MFGRKGAMVMEQNLAAYYAGQKVTCTPTL